MTHPLSGLWAALLAAAAPAQPADEMTLAFTLQAGLPVVAARIDGREARLLIDSGGAAALALRADWAPPEAQAGTTRSQDAQGQARSNATLAVGAVELAGQRLSPAPSAQTWGKAQRPAGVDGYLGWAWLRERRWIIDYAAGRLQLLAPDSPWPALCGPVAVPFEMLGSLAVLRLQTANGEPLTLGLDTGASRNVIRPALAGAVGHGTLTLQGRPLQAGGFATVPLQVPGLDGFLGQDFFSRHRVCVDPAQRQLRMQPLAG